MKKITTIVIIIITITTTYSQNVSISPMISQTLDYIELIEKKYEQQIVHLEFDVFQNYNEIYKEMFAEIQYGIILFADEHYENISIAISMVENDEIVTVASQEGENGIAVLYFTPTKTDFYKFEITGKLKADSNYGFYSFLIFR